MAVYHWKGIEAGQKTDGTVEANSVAEAKAQLQQQKIIFTDLQLVGGTEAPKAAATQNNKNPAASAPSAPSKASQKETMVTSIPKHFRPKKVKNRELMIFTKKLATMIRSGLPMMKTLEMLESQTDNKNFKIVVHMIYKDVEAGATLSEAFEKYPMIFDTIYINLLRAGETSGKLVTFLERLVLAIEKAEKIRAKVKGAMMYPTILLFVGIAVLTLMMIKVVPVFEQMFSSMGGELPAPTQMIVNVSHFLRDPSGGGVLAMTLVGIYVGFKMIIAKSYPIRKKYHSLLLRLPIVKDVITKSTLSKVAMIQGNLSAAGVAVIESLDIIKNSLTNVIFNEAMESVKIGIAEGKQMSELFMANPDVFPNAFCQMVEVGEETGNTDEMFETIARYYEEEFDLSVDRMTEMLEPMMIVFMGTTIGFIIVAMYMPVFKMGQTVMGGG